MHEWLTAEHLPSPYAAALTTPDTATTRIRVDAHLDVARRALRQHASQVDVEDPWFYAVPTHVLRDVYPYEDFTLLATAGDEAHRFVERDLFAVGADPGLRGTQRPQA